MKIFCSISFLGFITVKPEVMEGILVRRENETWTPNTMDAPIVFPCVTLQIIF